MRREAQPTPGESPLLNAMMRRALTIAAVAFVLVTAILPLTSGDSPSPVPAAPAPPTELAMALVGNGLDVRVGWRIVPGEAGVDHYEVVRSSVHDATGAGYPSVSGPLPLGTSSWTDLGAASAPGGFFYRVLAVAPDGSASAAAGQGAAHVRTLTTGPALVSVPVITPSPYLTDHFRGTVHWSTARRHDSSRVDAWQGFDRAKAGTAHGTSNTLWTTDRTQGVWVDVDVPGDYRVAGIVPCSTSIALRSGWNLVGYPGANARAVAAATAGLTGPLRIEGFHATISPYFLEAKAPADLLRPMEGYWIHSPADQTWTLVNDPDPGCVGSGGLAPGGPAYPEPASQQYEPIGLWFRAIVDVCVSRWDIGDAYFLAAVVKKESWFEASLYNAGERAAYESGQPTWHGEYYGKGLLQITGPWVAGTPLPNQTDWQYNMPPEAVWSEAPVLTDAYDGRQNLARGCWYLSALLDHFGGDQYKAATAYRWGWQGIDLGWGYPWDSPYNNEYVNEVFQFKAEYLADVGLSP